MLAELERRINPEQSRVFDLDRLRESRAMLDRIMTAPAFAATTNPPPTRFTIVGSNGKGSTAFSLARIARADRATPVGLFTSPHLRSVLERIRVNGRPVSARTALGGLGCVREAAEGDWERLSYFELTFLIAVAVFRMRGCRTEVYEAGLGGRWDATRAVRAEHVLLMPIELEHTSVLGGSHLEILDEKVAVLTERTRSLCVYPQPNVSEEDVRTAAARFAPNLSELSFYDTPGTVPAGEDDYLSRNLAFALECYARATGRRPGTGEPPPAVPGRLENRATRLTNANGRPVALLFDPAHNPAAFEVTDASLRGQGLEARATLVLLGLLGDRDPAPALERLRELGYVCRQLTGGPLHAALPEEHDSLALAALPESLRPVLERGHFAACVFLGTHRTHGDFRRTWRAFQRPR